MTLEERQAHIRGIRNGLLSQAKQDRVEALRKLYGEIARQGLLWFDVVGHVAKVEAETTHLEGLVELILCLIFGDAWPPEDEDVAFGPSSPGGGAGDGSSPCSRQARPGVN